MARFIQLGDKVFNLDRVSTARCARDANDKIRQVVIRFGETSIEFDDAAKAGAFWERLLKEMGAEKWES